MQVLRSQTWISRVNGSCMAGCSLFGAFLAGRSSTPSAEKSALCLERGGGSAPDMEMEPSAASWPIMDTGSSPFFSISAICFARIVKHAFFICTHQLGIKYRPIILFIGSHSQTCC